MEQRCRPIRTGAAAHGCVSLCAQVNGVNVVKVGHKQVVSLIRQGGNHLVMKVVSVSRKPESEEVVRKKGRWRGLCH